MGYFLGFCKALLIYISIATALLLTFGFEFAVLVAGLLTGSLSDSISGKGVWLPILVLVLSTMVFLQCRLPRRMRDAFNMHQMSLDGAQATLEQLFVRAVIVSAYVIVLIFQVASVESFLTIGSLTFSCFLVLLPAVQATVARGRFSLIDYVLLARAAPTSKEPTQNFDHRDGQVALSLAVAVLSAFVTANSVKGNEWLSYLSLFRSSNPAVMGAILSGAYEFDDGTSEPSAFVSRGTKDRIKSTLDTAGIKVIEIQAAGPTTIEFKPGSDPGRINVAEAIVIQVALPSLSTKRAKIVFQDAADRVCKAELEARADRKSIAVVMVVSAYFDGFLFDLRAPFVCADLRSAKPAQGLMSFGFGLTTK